MPPYTTNHRVMIIDDIIDKVINMKIDISPNYQHDIVWTDEQMSQYISSIIAGMAPNPIVLCKNKQGNIRTCIDGKQRLATLLRFRQNKVKWGDFLFDDLSAFERMVFLNSPVHVIEYSKLTYTEQKDIFSRINYQVPLSEEDRNMSSDDELIGKIQKFYNNVCIEY